MLKRSLRLTDTKEFQNIYRRGRFHSTALLSVNVLPNRGITKVGVVASKKVNKRATERNLLKRQVREIVRLMYPTLKPGFSIIISIRPGSVGKKYEQFERDIRAAFMKLGVFSGNTQENS